MASASLEFKIIEFKIDVKGGASGRRAQWLDSGRRAQGPDLEADLALETPVVE